MLISEEKLFLSEAIDYERDIEPYRFITVYSGVGSGKNTFAGKLMNGDEKCGFPKKTVFVYHIKESYRRRDACK